MLGVLVVARILVVSLCSSTVFAVPYKKKTYGYGYKVFKHKPKIIYDAHDAHEYEEKYHGVNLDEHYGYGTKVVRTTIDEHDYHDNHGKDYQDLQIAYGLHDPHHGDHGLDFLHHKEKKYEIVHGYKKGKKSYSDDCHDYHDDFFGLHEHQGAHCGSSGYGHSKTHDFHEYFEHNSGGYDHHDYDHHDPYDKHDSYGYDHHDSYDKHDGYGYDKHETYDKHDSYGKQDSYGYDKHDPYDDHGGYGYEKPKYKPKKKYHFEEHHEGGHGYGYHDDHDIYKPKIVVIKKVVPLTTTTTPIVPP